MRFTVEENIDLVHAALNGVESLPDDKGLGLGVAHFNGESLNMLARPLRGPGVELLGFFTPSSLGIEGLPQFVDNRARLDQTPSDLHSIHRVGKGVGARLYNTQESLASWHDQQPAALYSVKIKDLVDARRASDTNPLGWAWRIIGHAIKQARVSPLGQRLSQHNDLKSVVEGVHASYGTTDAVLHSVPPRATIRQRLERGQHDPEVAPGSFVLVRKGLTLQRVARLATAATSKD
jgi:hypothetical protein